MGSSMDKLAKELKSLVNESDSRKPTPYDTQAEVKRVDGDVVWVHIPGGVEETPVRKTIDAKKGDLVNVHVANGSAWVTGNATRPPTDDTVAIAAKGTADSAAVAAQAAWEYADSAHEAANVAWEYADSAHAAADTAWGHAEEARVQAVRATGYANDALTQLGVVEEVVDTLTWISEHGTYKKTTDTEVVSNKLYFTLTGTAVSVETLGDGTKLSNLESYYELVSGVYVKTQDTTYNSSKTYYTVEAELIATPTGNPSVQGYYEIDSVDQAVQNYISSHLALTDSGLWVVKDNQGYKILLAHDGLRVYDDTGHLVSTFGENITFDASRPQKIGNESTYIMYYDSNRDGVPDSIEISGSNVRITNSVEIGGMPTKVSDLTNDAGYQNSSQVSYAISTATSGLASSVTAKDQYYLSTSSTSAAGGSWQDTIPTWSSGKYIWTRVATTTTTSSGSSTVYTPTNGQYDSSLTTALSTASSAQESANGAASSIVTTKQYYLSTSTSSATGGSWQDTIPTWAASRYIWTRYKIVKTPVSGTATTTYSPSENGTYDSGLTSTLQKANDAAPKSSAVQSTVSVYYRSSTNSPPSISTGSSIGTSASTDNAWEYVMPQPKRNRYFYTCERYTYADGTVNFSAVRSLDNATYTSKWCHESDNVYIDGGALYANSVTASKMAAGSITIGNMDASTKSQVENSQLSGAITEAGNKAESYITAIDSAGIKVHAASNTTSNYAKINADGLEVYKGGNSVAKYGDEARIGKSDTRHIEIKDGGIEIYSGNSKIGHFGYGLGNSAYGTAYNPYYTFGTRVSTGELGNFSVVAGHDCTSSGYISYAEGEDCIANTRAAHAEGYGSIAGNTSNPGGIWCPHAEGYLTVASGDYSHAEGRQTKASGGEGSHAEGRSTTASGDSSHAEGYGTRAIGEGSHAAGYYTTASGDWQTVVGINNVSDTSSMFIVGGGDSSTSRNAMTVSKTGNVVISGQLTQGSDRRLKEHISYLGEDAVDFIRLLQPAYYLKDDKKQVGFYAQDVEEIDRWDCMVGEDANGYKILSYTELIAPIVKYCQYLEKRIEELERG